MTRSLPRLAALAVAVLAADRAAAQAPFGPRLGPPQLGGASSPGFSPYLNLARPNSNPAINYYGLVRPQIQTQNSLRSIQSQVGANTAGLNQMNDPATGLPLTGHTAVFLNTGGYFMNLYGGGSGSGVGGRGGFGTGGFGTGGFGTGIGMGGFGGMGVGGMGGLNRPGQPPAPRGGRR